MVRIPTVLILGAGASAPFGFPIGSELREKILRDFGNDLAPGVEVLTKIGYSRGEIRSFCEAFRFSGKDSIDAFLERRNTLIEIGKAAIALEMIPCESLAGLFKDGNNLYSYLINRYLNASPAEFTQNKLSVLTYNYDRSFEQYLFTSLKNSFGLEDYEAAIMVNSIPIVHLHGHLGTLPWQREGGRDYAQDSTPEAIRQASQTIKIIHRPVETYPEFLKAYKLIEKAERLIFLGFGYHEDNVKRLKIPWSDPRREIFGSSFKLTRSEITGINQRLFGGRLKLGNVIGNDSPDALNYLREEVDLS